METAMRWLLQEEFNIGKAILMALIVLVVGRWIAGAIKNKLRNNPLKSLFLLPLKKDLLPLK